MIKQIYIGNNYTNLHELSNFHWGLCLRSEAIIIKHLIDSINIEWVNHTTPIASFKTVNNSSIRQLIKYMNAAPIHLNNHPNILRQ